MDTTLPDRKTYYEHFRKKGYTRRDFMRFCTILAACLGLDSSGVGQVSKAFMTKFRLPVIWLHFQECTGCTESFIRTSHPMVADIILDQVSLDYSETLMAASGKGAENALKQTMERNRNNYILCVEGSIPVNDDGVYCCIGGRSAVDILKDVSEGAKAIISWGSCASHGSVQAAHPNPTGATPVHKLIKGKPIIKVPGCPPIGEVMAGVLTHIIVFDKLPALNKLGRARGFYSKRVHDTCYRRPFYDAGLFVESFEDENAQKGYCLYKVGCRGPSTYNACGIVKWNNGTSFPIQSGHGCLGCSEANFFDNGPFYSRISNFPGFGIESSADKIGAIATGVAVAGVTAHAIATNFRKRKILKQKIEEGKEAVGEKQSTEN